MVSQIFRWWQPVLTTVSKTIRKGLILTKGPYLPGKIGPGNRGPILLEIWGWEDKGREPHFTGKMRPGSQMKVGPKI